ncbi:hypothetical protein [uncultured Anaerovibrio sp.]|uniref:hypothetical protein n=1 Tax=uncultured Anaerovibrio sp. TaxID=361586 RepID=UPI00261F68DB|nr:hypothetical protein [uncultured Anaerovibrio sp.]
MMKPDKTNKLTDEELEQVSGGCLYEISNDSKFLNVLLRGTGYHHCDRYGKARIFWGADDLSPSDDVRNSWEGLGIRVEFHTGPKHNEYFLNGKQITRDEAWDYAEKVVGKHLGRADWDW